eukprot:GHVU01053897.1.p1 GENE.GHVU01053897.1~~GHVU01053897.1.p1  ORF type:complete len:317 (+),score=25.14 GHVU01053897.1:28-951(+)
MNKRKKTNKNKGRLKPTEQELDRSIPRSFVVKRGTVDSSCAGLVQDLRNVMSPYCAVKLKEKKSNTIKDYLSVCGVFGVTNILMVSQSTSSPCLRLLKVPGGPTYTFKINKFCTMSDIRASQKRPRISKKDFLNPPLVLLHGFSKGASADAGAASARFPTELLATTLQRLFPPIDINKFQLSTCSRVVIFALKPGREDGCPELSMRQYGISLRPGGVSKGIQKLITPSSKGLGGTRGGAASQEGSGMPGRRGGDPLDMAGSRDVASYVLSKAQAGGGCSDSEVEDAVPVKVPGAVTRSRSSSTVNVQ